MQARRLRLWPVDQGVGGCAGGKSACSDSCADERARSRERCEYGFQNLRVPYGEGDTPPGNTSGDRLSRVDERCLAGQRYGQGC